MESLQNGQMYRVVYPRLCPGPLLLILYVNNLPDEVKSYCKLFVDDAKLYKDLQNLEDLETIQNDLNKLCQWTIKCLMIFNVQKCKVKHLSKNNPRFSYKYKF